MGYYYGKEAPVELFITVAVPTAILTAFAFVSGLWGVDSRPGIGDDHTR